MTEASHQLHWVPKAQESKAQKERQRGQQGVVLVDLEGRTNTETQLPSASFPHSKTEIHFSSQLTGAPEGDRGCVGRLLVLSLSYNRGHLAPTPTSPSLTPQRCLPLPQAPRLPGPFQEPKRGCFVSPSYPPQGTAMGPETGDSHLLGPGALTLACLCFCFFPITVCYLSNCQEHTLPPGTETLLGLNMDSFIC